MSLGKRKHKTEHAGAKNGGGHWGTRAEAKTISKKLRRSRDKDLLRRESGRVDNQGNKMSRLTEKDSVLLSVVDVLVDTYGCHTIIFYGSRARGDATADSDYDLVGFRATGKKEAVIRVLQEKYIDAYVYPEAESSNEEEFLRLRGGTVLRQQNGFADDLFVRIEAKFAKGPKPIKRDEETRLRLWIQKMLSRAERNDIEGNYRRVWLQQDLLENYFVLRKMWFLGPKESFKWLRTNDRETFDLYEHALRPNTEPRMLKRLAERVLSADEDNL